MDTSYLKKLAVLCFCLGFGFVGYSPSVVLKTPAEQSRYTQYTQFEEIVRFLSEMDFSSSEVTVQVIGKTKEVEGFSAKDLFLVVISEEGAGSPDALNRTRPTILLTASQHGGEQSAKEAALWLIRDLAVGELRPLLRKVNFLIIPQANPYGNYFDRRENEQDLDLNRDHVKLESDEVKAIHRVFRKWMPEVTIDVHEKGDDYYRVSIGCVSNVNIHPKLQEFSRHTILPDVEKNLEKQGITFHEYLVTEEMGVNTSAGANLRPEDLSGREEMKRFSTTDLNDGRNSLGIYETLSFIQEGASRHDLDTLEQRTQWQYSGLRSFVEAVASRSEEVVALVGGLRRALMKEAAVYSSDDLVHLRMDYARDEREATLTIKRFERAKSPIVGVLKIDKKAGEPVSESDLESEPAPSDTTIVTAIVKNWFPAVASTLSVPRPLGYIIPAKYQDVIEVLLDHGISIGMFTQDLSQEVEAYAAGEVIPAKYDYLPPDRIEVEKRSLALIIKKGDYYVACEQPGADLIPCLLEPQSQFGLIRYWKFRLVPENGEIFAFYRLVKPVELPLVPYRSWGK
jgi:hypothetical protein